VRYNVWCIARPRTYAYMYERTRAAAAPVFGPCYHQPACLLCLRAASLCQLGREAAQSELPALLWPTAPSTRCSPRTPCPPVTDASDCLTSVRRATCRRRRRRRRAAPPRGGAGAEGQAAAISRPAGLPCSDVQRLLRTLLAPPWHALAPLFYKRPSCLAF